MIAFLSCPRRWAAGLAVLVLSTACDRGAPLPAGVAITADRVLTLPAGAEARVRVAGTGADTVLVLPTSPLPSDYLIETLGATGEGLTLLFVDLPGRGRLAAGSPARTNVADDAATLVDVVQSLGLGRYSLMADGTAAATAVWFAAAQPQSVNRVMLFSPVGPVFESVRGIALTVGDTAMNRAFYSATAAGDHRRDPDGFCRRFWGFYLSPMAVADSISVRRLAPVVCRDQSREVQAMLDANATRLAPLIRTDLRPQLGALTMPILIVQGDAQPTYAYLAREWKTAVPAVHLRFVAGWPQFPWLHQPAEVAQVVHAFMKGQPIPGEP